MRINQGFNSSLLIIEFELRSSEQEVDNRPEVQSQHTRIEKDSTGLQAKATSDNINTFGLVQ